MEWTRESLCENLRGVLTDSVDMSWQSNIGALAVLSVAGAFFYNQFAEADKAREVRRAEQLAIEAKQKAERDAADRLLADPVATRAEIERRLTSWIKSKDDVYILELQSSSGRQSIQTIPRSRQWSVQCNSGSLIVEFPPALADEPDAALKLRVLPGKLDAQQCREYVSLVAERMGYLTRGQ